MCVRIRLYTHFVLSIINWKIKMNRERLEATQTYEKKKNTTTLHTQDEIKIEKNKK